jgi:hypothetical protein
MPSMPSQARDLRGGSFVQAHVSHRDRSAPSNTAPDWAGRWKVDRAAAVGKLSVGCNSEKERPSRLHLLSFTFYPSLSAILPSCNSTFSVGAQKGSRGRERPTARVCGIAVDEQLLDAGSSGHSSAWSVIITGW